MPFKRLRSKLFFAAALALLVFIASGYLLSDALFFKRLIKQNSIRTPEEAFAFVDQSTDYPAKDMKLALGATPRYMLTEQKYLYCDQSAILMATIVHELGYETRLVDLVGDDGESHHTILEVKQDGRWKTYDTTYILQGATYQESAIYYESRQPFHARPVYRPYPKFYNWLIQNNFYLKHLALFLRRERG
ncbi:MAG TPA: hypothetical protein VGB17_10410 [Pyrinomonadaceae bacterium]